MNTCTWSMPESGGPSGTFDVNLRLIGSCTVVPSAGDVIVSFAGLSEFAPAEPQAATASIPTTSTRANRMWRGMRVLLGCVVALLTGVRAAAAVGISPDRTKPDRGRVSYYRSGLTVRRVVAGRHGRRGRAGGRDARTPLP